MPSPPSPLSRPARRGGIIQLFTPLSHRSGRGARGEGTLAIVKSNELLELCSMFYALCSFSPTPKT